MHKNMEDQTMVKRCFIITGASRGIGEAVAKSLLDHGDTVYGISRTESSVLGHHSNYNHISFDLSELGRIAEIIGQILHPLESDEFDMICLINNAAMLEPLLPIEDCQSEDIMTNIHSSLIAPIVLTSYFIKATQGWVARRKVINISSGSGVNASPSMSIYSTVKSGLNMFTRCVGLEQSNNENGVEILSVDPGMVDTSMQLTARNNLNFGLGNFFKDAYRKGRLQSTDQVASRLLKIINKKYKTGKVIKYISR
jgi:benzil reductase ((S)-benzoin forming)